METLAPWLKETLVYQSEPNEKKIRNWKIQEIINMYTFMHLWSPVDLFLERKRSIWRTIKYLSIVINGFLSLFNHISNTAYMFFPQIDRFIVQGILKTTFTHPNKHVELQLLKRSSPKTYKWCSETFTFSNFEDRRKMPTDCELETFYCPMLNMEEALIRW